jgi:kumamolisin
MRRTIGLFVVAYALMYFGLPATSHAQTSQGQIHGAKGHVLVPQSSTYKPTDAGIRAHTNVQTFLLDGVQPKPDEAPPFFGLAFETPASLACVYRLVEPVPGCNPNVTTENPSGGSGSIAIVDAFDDPTAASDLAAYSLQFGLPPANFTVVYASGSEPPVDPTGGWELEESLDIEMAHAMAPGAHIYLVEAPSNFDTDLYAAVQLGANLVACGNTTCTPVGHGKGEVSMGWGGVEYDGEDLFDIVFRHPGVVFLAAAGDAPGVEYPCTSSQVVCVGGTSVARSIFTGNFMYQVAWMDAGGGFSSFEPRPFYQDPLAEVVGDTRGVPDISFDGNPTTGVWVFDSNPSEGAPEGGWSIAGGTSVGSPAMAGVINAAGHFYNSSVKELEEIYSHPFRNFSFSDINRGYCGPYVTFAATRGWDFCTGMGTPWGYGGK